MIIKFTKVGGGHAIGCTINVDELLPEQQKKWKLLISRSKITASERTFCELSSDLYIYRITIDHGDSEIKLEYDDITYPQRLLELINYLEANSRVIDGS